MSASGYLSPGNATKFKHVVADGSGSAAARRVALTESAALGGGPGQIWVWSTELVAVKVGDAAVDADGLAASGLEWTIPPGTGVVIKTSGSGYVSVLTAGAVAVYIHEVYA